MLARAEDAASLDDAVALYNARTATAILPADEAAAFGTALLPRGDDELKAMVGTAVPERDAGFEAPVELAVAAISDALDGVTLSRDDLHEQLRRRLPDELLPWCAGCQSHHARRGLLVMASLRGRLCIAGRAGRQPAFARTDQHAGWEPARGRRGASWSAATCRPTGRRRRPTSPSGPGSASRTRAACGRSWTTGSRRPTRRQAEGVRLLATGDPLLLGRDREPW